MTEEKVVAKGAIGMRQSAGDGINAGGLSIGLLGHPATFFAMDTADSDGTSAGPEAQAPG